MSTPSLSPSSKLNPSSSPSSKPSPSSSTDSKSSSNNSGAIIGGGIGGILLCIVFAICVYSVVTTGDPFALFMACLLAQNSDSFGGNTKSYNFESKRGGIFNVGE